MNVFISYSNDDRAIADALEVALRQEGHEVFFDRTQLEAGEAFHERIRDRIDAADLFIFVMSPSSVRPESYAMTELAIARKRWPNPSGRVVPVLARATPMPDIPPYLAAVTFEQGGNLVASTLATVARINAKRRRARVMMVSIGLVVLVAIALGVVNWRSRVSTDSGVTACYLSARVVRPNDLSGYVLDTSSDAQSDSFLLDGEGRAHIHVGPLTARNAHWALTLRSPVGQELARRDVQGCPAEPIELALTSDIDVVLSPR